MLLLSDFEKLLLKELKDLSISHIETRNSNDDQLKATAALKCLSKVLWPEGERAYGACLRYCNSNHKHLRLNKAALVKSANYCSQAIGFKELTTFIKKTINNMGWKGAPGLCSY